MRATSFKQQFIGLMLISTILLGNLSTFAQKRDAATKTSAPTNGNTTASNQKANGKKDCKGNYSGQVAYKREIKQHHPGRYGSSYDRQYVFQSTIPIRDDGSTQGSIYPSVSGIEGSFNFYGLAEATKTVMTNDLQVSEKDDYCKLSIAGMNGKTREHCETLAVTKEEAFGKGSVNVFLSFQGDKYKISLDNPKVDGLVTRTTKVNCTGKCIKQDPFNHETSSSYKNDALQGTYTDPQPFDPTNFNRLSGAFTRVDGEETETITWNLARCAPPLQIADVNFETHRYPDKDKWVGIDPLQGTIDGNLVKIKARVFNSNGETSYATVKFTDQTIGETLTDGAISVQVKPGETRDVEYDWDTSGFAWDENQKATLARRIKVEVSGGDAMEKKVLIIPKPVINVHGLWSNAAAWADWHQYLRDAHGSLAWEAFPVGEDPAHGKMNTGEQPGNSGATNTIYQNAKELEKQIKFVQQSRNAWHVDIVAHSMGGLISRQYINSFMNIEFDLRPTVTHLVMLGTPNQGSPCADTVNQSFEDNGYNNMHAMRELRPILVRAFNTRITNRKQVKFSILAGTPIPFTCLTSIRGDGVVPIQSALWTIADHEYAPRDHVSLTGIEDFKEFVMPRIAIGPKKAQSEMALALIENRNSDVLAATSGDAYQKADRYGFGEYFQNVSYKNTKQIDDSPEDDSQKDVTTRQKVELAAKQTKEIEIPVKNGSYAGVLLIGSAGITATLTDANGAVVGKNEAGLQAFKQPFRTIAVERPIVDGVWKLKLENLGEEAATAFITAAAGNRSTSNFTVEAGKPNAAGQVPLVAKITANNAPVPNAKITATIIGQAAPIEFFDDGRHADGAANDGVYGATTEKLAGGDYTVEAKAEANNQTQIAVAQIIIGGAAVPSNAPKPTKTPVKRRGK